MDNINNNDLAQLCEPWEAELTQDAQDQFDITEPCSSDEKYSQDIQGKRKRVREEYTGSGSATNTQLLFEPKLVKEPYIRRHEKTNVNEYVFEYKLQHNLNNYNSIHDVDEEVDRSF